MPRIAFRNFTGGEVTPTLSARYDLQKAGTFLQCCENFIPNLHGDIERRPGTIFLNELSGEAFLLPFQFNTDPEHNFALVFMEDGIRVAHAGGLLEGVLMQNPYAMEDVHSLSIQQVADVIYIAHRKYVLRKLTRSGNAPSYVWDIQPVVLNKYVPAPENVTAEFVKDNPDDDAETNYTLRYVITAVDADGTESLASDVAETEGKYPTDWVVGNHVNLSWPAMNGAVEYNVYRESAGYYGFIGVADGKELSGGEMTGFAVGNETAVHVHFSAHYERNVVITNGYTGNPHFGGPTISDSDVTDAEIVVSADASRTAYTFAGNLLVWTTLTTHTRTWEYSLHADSEGTWNEWDYTDDTSEESFWMLVYGVNASSPAGIYENFTRGNVGEDPNKPKGTIGAFTIEPAYVNQDTITFQDQNFEPDTSMTPKEDWNPFENGNNPSVVAVHQQRLVLGGTKNEPAVFYMSRTGDYENFRKSRPLQDDDPVEYMIASGSVDDIKWMSSFGDLIVGTSGAEYKVSSSGAAVSSSDVKISTESFWGSSRIAPMVIGNSIIHCQRSGSHVRDLYYSWENDGYAGNDLSLLAPQLVEGHTILQWAYQQSPGSNIWAVREDGVLLCLTYMQEQRVYGWSRHITQGKVKSVVSLCGRNEDVVMAVTEREIGGVKKYFLERFAGRFGTQDGIEKAFYVDAGKTVNNVEAVLEVSGFAHLEGMEVSVLADGSPEMGHVVEEGGKIVLNAPAKTITAGLGYASVLAPMPVETDAEGGSTLGKRRGYGRVILRLFRSVGGSYAASHEGDIFSTDAWKERESYEIPFLPARYGEAVEPYSGDIEISLPSGMDRDSLVYVIQDKPLPFRLAAMAANIDFGEI